MFYPEYTRIAPMTQSLKTASSKLLQITPVSSPTLLAASARIPSCKLACSEGWASLVPAVCGSLVGGFYVMDTMSIQSVRLPKLIYWAFSVSDCSVSFVMLHIPQRDLRETPVFAGDVRSTYDVAPLERVVVSICYGVSSGGKHASPSRFIQTHHLFTKVIVSIQCWHTI